MKRSRFAFLFAPLLAIAVGLMAGMGLTACDTLTQGSTATAGAPTFNQMAVPTVKSVTASRQVARTLLDAGKINVARFDEANKKLDTIVAGVVAARGSLPTDQPLTPAQQEAVKADLAKVAEKADQVGTNLKEGKAP